MNVDLESIARRGRCEASNLRSALPLIEQGFSPPYLARYRRDELGGVSEANLWAVSEAVKAQQAIEVRKEQLLSDWKSTPLADASLGYAIEKAQSKRMLDRLGRRVKLESHETVNDAIRLASRVLNPRKGDSADLKTLSESVDGITNAEDAVANFEKALAGRLAVDPRMIQCAVQWLGKHAKVYIAEISDPHINKPETKNQKEEEAKAEQASVAPLQADAPQKEDDAPTEEPAAESPQQPTETAEVPETTKPEPESKEETAAAESAESLNSPAQADAPENQADSPEKSDSTPPDAAVAETKETPESEPNEVENSETAVEPETEESTDSEAQPTEPAKPKSESKTLSDKPKEKKNKKQDAGSGEGPHKPKKVSPRQRRRRWLMSVLQPLKGKRLGANQLSSFQTVMLARALRSQVVQCSFEYDANKLVEELQRTASKINSSLSDTLKRIVLDHESSVRAIAEAAWWDELQERASGRLLGVAADHLRAQVNREGIDANVVMSIDAVGPRTAAAAIVASDGRVVHCEDLPCQLSASMRSQAVLRMGELIHTHHVDLIIISNGPARRGCLVAVNELVKQSPENSIRWTLADRSGADAYAGSGIADQEMRATPRRFRAAAWVAFSVMQPAQAVAKVDPLKLRLGSFQRELADKALLDVLDDVIVSGASRGGVDVNSAPISWLAKLPGMTESVAGEIDYQRRKSLIKSRDDLLSLEKWDSGTGARQALPFLRVFGSEEALDGTLIHPDDYALAKKLAGALEIELPPNSPPGYEPPKFDEDAPSDATELKDVSKPEGGEELVIEKPVEADPNKPFGEGSELPTETDTPEAEASAPEASEETSEPKPEAIAATEPSSEPETDTTSQVSSEETPTSEADAAELAPSETSPAEGDSEEASKEATDESASAEKTEAPKVAERIRRPVPEKAKIDKCVKEWQIGAYRAQQLVQWLCDPFGDSDPADSAAHGVFSKVPSLDTLKPGDQVIGIVVGVMPFGVFVELTPDCSGLIHVSKVSDRFVEDLHEAIQVGDVVTAWVTSVDIKRRRVALSAISPEREEELKQQRENRSNDFGDRGRGPRGRDRGAQRGENRESRGDGQRGDAGRGRGGKPSGQRGDSNREGRGGKPGGRQDRSRGRGNRDNRGRDRRGGGRERRLESYRVTSSEPVKPISDAMKKGDEPLRSFGDLMQFYTKPEEEASKPKTEKPQASKPTDSAKPTDTGTNEGNESQTPAAESQPTAPEAADSTTEREATANPPTPTENTSNDTKDSTDMASE